MLVLFSGCIDLIQDESGSASLIGSKANPADEAFHSVESSVLGVATNISTDAEVPIDVELSRNKGHGTYIASSRGKKVLNSQLIFNTADFNAHTGSLIGMGYRDHYVSGIFQDRYYFEYNYTSKWFVVNVGAFSENIFGGMTGRSTTTVENVSSGDSIEVCGGNYCNTTKVEINITDTNTQKRTWNLTSNETVNNIQVWKNDSWIVGMQNNMFDSIPYDENGTSISFFEASNSSGDYSIRWLKIPHINNGQTYFREEFNNVSTVANSKSSIDDTMWFGDTYTGVTIDTSKWDETDTGAHISQNNELIFDGGTSTWGQTGVASDNNFTRPFIYQTKWNTTSATNTRSFGVKDTTAGVSYADFVYLFHADPGADFKLFEDGGLVRNVENYAADTDYWLKIEVLSTGAKYYRSTDNENWNLIYTSSYSTESPLKIGATSYNEDQTFDDTFILNYTTANLTWESEGDISNISSNFTAGTHESANHNITDGAFSESFSVQNINSTPVYFDGYGTATVNVTVFTTDDPLQTTKTYANGYKNGTMYINHDANITDVLIIANLDNSSVEYSGTIINLSNDQNVTDIRYNSTNVIWNSTQVNNSVTHWYNYSLPVNNASINAQTNQTCEWNLTCTIPTSASDVDGSSQINYTTTINGTTVYGANPEFTNTSKLTLGTHTLLSNVTDKNGTISTVEANWPWSNLSKFLEISDTTAPSIVTNLANTIGDYWVNYTWTNPTESDFANVSVFFEGALVGNTTQEWWNYTAGEGQTVDVELKSQDIRGNINATTVTDSVTMSTTQSNQIIGGW